ncbi:MAG: hypothetical protein Q7J69_00895, partial [Candidatus Omnitrophota bacterium]|nr:hypothetical protein [Candidatus Omnitrophota bacterium]
DRAAGWIHASGVEETFEVGVGGVDQGTAGFDRIEIAFRSRETDRLAGVLGLINSGGIVLVRRKVSPGAAEAFPFFAVSDGKKVALLPGAGADADQLWRAYVAEKIEQSKVFESMQKFPILQGPDNVRIESPNKTIYPFDSLKVTVSAAGVEEGDQAEKPVAEVLEAVAPVPEVAVPIPDWVATQAVIDARNAAAEQASAAAKADLRSAFGSGPLAAILGGAGTAVYSGGPAILRLNQVPGSQLVAVIGAGFKEGDPATVKFTPASAAVRSIAQGDPAKYRVIQTSLGHLAIVKEGELSSNREAWETVAQQSLPSVVLASASSTEVSQAVVAQGTPIKELVVSVPGQSPVTVSLEQSADTVVVAALRQAGLDPLGEGKSFSLRLEVDLTNARITLTPTTEALAAMKEKPFIEAPVPPAPETSLESSVQNWVLHDGLDRPSYLLADAANVLVLPSNQAEVAAFWAEHQAKINAKTVILLNSEHVLSAEIDQWLTEFSADNKPVVLRLSNVSLQLAREDRNILATLIDIARKQGGRLDVLEMRYDPDRSVLSVQA